MSTLTVNFDKANKKDLIAAVKYIDEILQSKYSTSVLDIFEEKDSANFKWDVRVHDASKKKDTNGRWLIKHDATREEVNVAHGIQRELIVEIFNTEYFQEAEKKFLELERLIKQNIKIGTLNSEMLTKIKAQYCLSKLSDAKTNLALIEELIKKICESII